MIRTRRTLAAFLLALAVALPAAALPAREGTQAWKGLLASLWQRLAPVASPVAKALETLNLSPRHEDPVSSQEDGDSRSSMDPNG
jgi:hypothetical protein